MLRQREEGSVTAELALGMVALTLMIGALSAVAGAAVAQLRVSGAAAAAAREIARGADQPATDRLVQRLAGDSVVEVVPAGELTTVTVRQSYRLMLPGRPALTLTGRAVAVREQP